MLVRPTILQPMAEDRDASARKIIDDGRYMTLATVGADGQPWASPILDKANPEPGDHRIAVRP